MIVEQETRSGRAGEFALELSPRHEIPGQTSKTAQTEVCVQKEKEKARLEPGLGRRKGVKGCCGKKGRAGLRAREGGSRGEGSGGASREAEDGRRAGRGTRGWRAYRLH